MSSGAHACFVVTVTVANRTIARSATGRNACVQKDVYGILPAGPKRGVVVAEGVSLIRACMLSPAFDIAFTAL